MSASDVVTLLVAGGILYISYKLSKEMSNQTASPPVGQVVQYSQQQPQQTQQVQNNTIYAAQLAAQAAEDERLYREYLVATEETIPEQGPSWLGCA
jgi:hypothetical protein